MSLIQSLRFSSYHVHPIKDSLVSSLCGQCQSCEDIPGTTSSNIKDWCPISFFLGNHPIFQYNSNPAYFNWVYYYSENHCQKMYHSRFSINIMIFYRAIELTTKNGDWTCIIRLSCAKHPVWFTSPCLFSIFSSLF